MKPFRNHVALAIDGGGIRGTMVAQALAVLEAELGRTCAELFQLTAGTSTGSIIAAAVAAGIPAAEVHRLYTGLGDTVFAKSWRTFWPLSRFKYSNRPLIAALRDTLGERTMGEYWTGLPQHDVVITVRDLVEGRTRFVKAWKQEYGEWQAWYAVLCSSSVPTYFPVVDGRFVDGGVGSFTNPCYVAAYEAAFCLGWPLEETTLISIGTGRTAGGLEPYRADHFSPLEWVWPLIDTFVSDASDQQVHLVHRFFPGLDFRRFQIVLDPPVALDDASGIPALTWLGRRLGEMILADEVDSSTLPPTRGV